MTAAVTTPASETKDIFVLDGGSVYPIPLSPGLFFSTPLLSWRGRLRMMTEPFQPARRDDEDESLADYVTRRLGREALEKFIGPVLGGIYNSDPEYQSIMVASPIMRQMEKESGSLIRATLKRMTQHKSGPKKPRFINFKEGMQQLPNEIAAQLKGDLRLNARVERINRNESGYVATLSTGEKLEAETIILATIANVSSALLADVAPDTAVRLSEIRHEDSGTMTLVYHENDLPDKPSINGLMIPRREKRAIDAMTVTSRKMPERSHTGYAVLRVYFGGSRSEMIDYNDAQLLKAVSDELRHLVGIQAEPLAYTVFRWKAGYPQARVNHLKLVDEIEATLPEGIYLTGSSYRGIAVPDCIAQARATVRRAFGAI